MTVAKQGSKAAPAPTAPTAPAIDSLPEQVLTRVFNHLRPDSCSDYDYAKKRANLRRCCLVSRKFRSAAQPVLWRHVQVESDKRAFALLRTPLKLREEVRAFKLKLDGLENSSYTNRSKSGASEGNGDVMSAEMVYRLVEALPRLEDFHCAGGVHYSGRGKLDAIDTVLLMQAGASLRKLVLEYCKIEGYNDEEWHANGNAYPANLAPRLESLFVVNCQGGFEWDALTGAAPSLKVVGITDGMPTFSGIFGGGSTWEPIPELPYRLLPRLDAVQVAIGSGIPQDWRSTYTLPDPLVDPAVTPCIHIWRYDPAHGRRNMWEEYSGPSRPASHSNSEDEYDEEDPPTLYSRPPLDCPCVRVIIESELEWSAAGDDLPKSLFSWLSQPKLRLETLFIPHPTSDEIKYGYRNKELWNKVVERCRKKKVELVWYTATPAKEYSELYRVPGEVRAWAAARKAAV
ncbi:hypothetical protein JCM10908_003607 [Rhodotorula pacifica]|uniref:uncharacterized protein n=1 Tax=Rhodotorula pacifica TaxID=1495444 RepID=UPI00316B6923